MSLQLISDRATGAANNGARHTAGTQGVGAHASDAASPEVPPLSQWQRLPQLVSIVAPVFREEEGIDHFVDNVVAVMRSLGLNFELILVEDDSPDRSWDRIAAVRQRYPAEVKGLSMSRRFGHQASLSAGFKYASGDVVICMDSDMQHPPTLLPLLLWRWSQGYQVVYTRRRTQSGRSQAAEMASTWFYRIMNKLSDVPFEEGTADFRLMDRIVADAVASFGERSLVFRGLINWAGYRRLAVDYDATARFAGDSKYTWKRNIRFAIECLFAFSLLPLKFGYYLGGASLMLSLAYSLWTVAWWMWDPQGVPGYTSLVLLVTFMGSLNLLCMGIMGEYVGRIHEQVKDRPLYLIKESFGFEATGPDASRSRTPAGANCHYPDPLFLTHKAG